MKIVLACSLFFMSIKVANSILTGSAGKNITYTLENNCLTLIGSGDIYNFTEKSTPWYANRSEVRTLVMSPGITSIGEYSFQYCSQLVKVTLSEDLREINHYAFHQCHSLESIILPNRITFIGALAFGSCVGLKSAQLSESLQLIHNFLFNNCELLETIKIPKSVKMFGRYSFRWCHSLRSIEIPDTVYKIGEGCFLDCPRLESFTFPKSLTNIPHYTFRYCRSLTSITIPSNIINIEESAFDLCENLNYVRYTGKTSPSYSNDVFSNTNVSIVYVNPKYTDEQFCGYPIQFYPSECFSMSQQFTESNAFSLTQVFTESNVFSISQVFSLSQSFTSSSEFTSKTSKSTTISLSQLLTYVKRKSVSFSISYLQSNTISITYVDDIFQYSYINTLVYYQKYFPYIIQILSPSYTATFIRISELNKLSISPEQLIGVVCGSVSVFFIILGIIIFAIRKQNLSSLNDEFDDLSFSSDDPVHIQNENETNADFSEITDCEKNL